MKKVYGYIRVSTAKQGEGVSLIVQKEAITRYAEQYNLDIIQWFEEKETAAKQGRPLFNTMLKLIKTKKADGVIMHKIDRSARNLKDWAELGNLIDQGIEVHFAHESLDLQARGGRLSADIQAVIAADYIRNLRQEAVKGLYGRLNQGIYPFRAPTGYLNNGSGKCKTIDPATGPLIRKAFELYATRQYSLRSLVTKMRQLGLTTINKKPITVTSLSHILNNSFYIGVIQVKGNHFKGIHEPIITPHLFSRVQVILKSKTNQRVRKTDFLFRKLIKCRLCGYSLIPEKQKGYIYYRCHTRWCPTKSIRETIIENIALRYLKIISLHPEEVTHLSNFIDQEARDWEAKQENLQQINQLQLRNIESRLDRLTDCYIEGGLDKASYEVRKGKLLIEIKEKEVLKNRMASDKIYVLKKVRKFLELSKNLMNSYQKGIFEEKRQILELVTSNLWVQEKKVEFPMVSPFLELSNRWNLSLSGDSRDMPLIKNTKDANSSITTLPVRGKPLSEDKLRSLLDLLITVISGLPEQSNDFDDYAV